MTLHQIADRIQAGLNGARFDGSLKFHCGDAGVIIMTDNQASTMDQDTNCTIQLPQDNLIELLTGKLNPMSGVMMG